MKDELYTVDEVARLLDLHPKTIRIYLREGRLKAKKIGKQWRITASEVRNFVGEGPGEIRGETSEGVRPEPLGEIEPLRPEGTDSAGGMKVRVSSVVDISVKDEDEALRLSNSVLAAMNSRDGSDGTARCDYLYDREKATARFIFWGRGEFIGNMLILLSRISE